jgi:hypothetical protein
MGFVGMLIFGCCSFFFLTLSLMQDLAFFYPASGVSLYEFLLRRLLRTLRTGRYTKGVAPLMVLYVPT